VPAHACCPLVRVRDATFQISPEVYLNYTEAGQGEEVVVALHGFGASLDTWREIRPALARHRRVFMPDLLGFGLSAHPPGFKYTIREQTDAIVAFLKFVHLRTGVHGITLVGHSYGGSVALAACLLLKDQHLPLVGSLVLIDALAFPQAMRFPLYINVLRVPVVNWFVLNLVPRGLRARYVLRHVFYRRYLVTGERVCRYAQFYDLPGAHRALIDTARQLGDRRQLDGFVSRIPEIDTPTLIIWGAHDRLIPQRQAGMLHNAMAASREVALLDTGHVPHEELPEATFCLIDNFLDAHAAHCDGLASFETTWSRSTPMPSE
jgi:pimeloyl-ACP methyl ester carboxylesterase